MAAIETYLNNIMRSVYGKDVRQAIRDAIQQCYTDASAGITPVITTETTETGVVITIKVGASTKIVSISNGTATDEQVDAYMEAYLEEHPEATTSVEDGMITYEKLSPEVQQQLTQNEVVKNIVKMLNKAIFTEDVSAAMTALKAAAGLRVCSVTYNLVGCRSNNEAAAIDEGESFTTTLIPLRSEYILDSVSIILNEEDVTEDVYDPETHVITVSNVNGALSISATVTTEDGYISGYPYTIVWVAGETAGTGGISARSDYSRTDYLPVGNATYVVRNCGYNITFYDSEKAGIKSYSGYSNVKVPVPYTAAYAIQICLTRSIPEDFTFIAYKLDDIDENTAWVNGESYRIPIISGLSLNSANGQVTSTENAYYSGSDFINCYGASKLTFGGTWGTSSGSSYNCFYDAEKNYIRNFSIGGGPDVETEVTVPENAAYFRTCAKYDTNNVNLWVKLEIGGESE